MRGYGQWITTCTVPRGLPGRAGTKIQDSPPPQNVAGQNGNINVSAPHTDDTADRIASATSLLYLQTALQAAEVSYANSAFDDALDQLTWLGRLLIRLQVTRTSRESLYDSGLDPAEPSQEVEAIRRKVFTLIQRMTLGLDYWGNARNFVPLLTQTAYSDVLDDLLKHAKTIEEAYISYRDARDDWAGAQAVLLDAISAQEAIILNRDNQFRELEEVKVELVTDIETLTNAYDESWHTVLQAGIDFKGAVARISGGCEFKQVMVAVASIATAVGTMGTGTSAVLAAWHAYNQFDAKKHDPEDRLGSLAEPKYKVDKIITIGKGVAEVANGVEKIADILGRRNVAKPELPSDAAKLIMSRQDLEQTLEPYRHLEEAKAYRERVDEFIELVTIRNDKILEYNTLANTQAEALSDIDAAESEVGRLRNKIIRRNVRHLPEFASYLSRANMTNKRAIMQLLYKQHRALEYWSGENSKFQLRIDSIDQLSNRHNHVKVLLLNAMENRGRIPQEIKFEDNVAKFSISKIGQQYFKRFKSTGKLIFRLPYNPHFENLALVRVTRVRIGLPGVTVDHATRGDDPFKIQLTHFGSATMRTVQGKLIEFRHEPRRTTLFYRAGSEVTRPYLLGGKEGLFIKLTPEGPWELSILDSMERVKLDSLHDVIIEFEGEFFSTN